MVYPLHGLGSLVDVVEQKVLTNTISCYKVFFEKKNITIYIPTKGVETSGMRSLIKQSAVEDVYQALKSQSKNFRVIWNRRSKEYEEKLNSGDIIKASEVLRDLYKNINNPNRSYTESVIYDEAIYRVVSELSTVLGKEYAEMEEKICSILDKYHETYQASIDDEIDDFTKEIEEVSLDDEEEEDDDIDDEDGDDESEAV